MDPNRPIPGPAETPDPEAIGTSQDPVAATASFDLTFRHGLGSEASTPTLETLNAAVEEALRNVLPGFEVNVTRSRWT